MDTIGELVTFLHQATERHPHLAAYKLRLVSRDGLIYKVGDTAINQLIEADGVHAGEVQLCEGELENDPFEDELEEAELGEDDEFFDVLDPEPLND